MKTIKLLATLRDLAGTKELEIPFQTGSARDLVTSIQQQSPALASEMMGEDGELTGLVHIFVNGRNIEWLDGLDTQIKETDTLLLIPPTAGG